MLMCNAVGCLCVCVCVCGCVCVLQTESLRFFGYNSVLILVPSIPSLLLHEVFHPFFLFQIYSIILWTIEAYYIFAVCIAVIALTSVGFTLVETRNRMIALSHMAKFEAPVNMLVDGEYVV